MPGPGHPVCQLRAGRPGRSACPALGPGGDSRRHSSCLTTLVNQSLRPGFALHRPAPRPVLGHSLGPQVPLPVTPRVATLCPG